MKNKIGIMGGTFNPIHYGHLMIAENAYEQFQLDKVVFMPTGHSPHKCYEGTEMTNHRCEMIRLAIADNDHFELSTFETGKGETSYTYQTLQALKEMHPEDTFYFILGADSLFDFEYWKEPQKICEQAVILAAVRDNLTESRVDAQISYLTQKFKGQIYRLNTPNFNVSSKTLRKRVAHQETIRYLLPETVEHYILEHDLFQADECLPVEDERSFHHAIEATQNPAFQLSDKEKKRLKKKKQFIEKELRQDLSENRYIHTIGVRDTAVQLAKIYGCDAIKAELAGLLHDCAKQMDDKEKIALCEKYNVSITEAEKKNPTLLHAKCGAIVAKNKYNVTDPEILHAIEVHTTGCPNMSLLDKIIYISDYIEPNRKEAPHLNELRLLAKADLRACLKNILSDTICYIQEKNGIMDETTVEAYQYYKNR